MPLCFRSIRLWFLLLTIGASAYGGTTTAVALVNPGFEGAYGPVDDPTAQISGLVAGGWQDNSSWANVSVQYSRETNNPHSGAACQKMSVTAATSGEAQFLQLISIQAASLYTASVWLRGEPGTQAIVRIQQAASPYTSYADTQVALTASWQQVSVQGYVVSTEPAFLMVALNAPGTMWVDDASASFTAAALAPTPNLGPIPTSFFGIHVGDFLRDRLQNAGFEPPFVSIGLNNPISGNIAAGWTDNSDWADVTVAYSQDSDHPHGGSASQKVDVQAVRSGAVQLVQQLDVVAGQTYTMTAWLRGDSGMTVNLILQDANPPYTYYAFAPAQLSSNWHQFSTAGQVNDTGQVLLMFQATEPGKFSADDVTFTLPGGQPVSGGVPWPAARFGTLRLWDANTSWNFLEPLKGVWNFEPLDTWIKAAQANGIPDIILTLGQSPPWASSNPDDVNYVGAGAPAPPADLQDWRDYITAVATRYKGVIRYYEIWNEPNDSTYYSGTVAQLVELTREAYNILKSIDPQNTVISPAAYEAGYLDEFLQMGGGQYIDVIGYHFYTTPPETTGPLIADVRLVMAKNGVAAKPLWDTEGASGDTTTPPDLAAAYMVRKYLTDLAFGAGRYDWYTWGPATPFCVGTEQNDGRTLTEAAQAYRYLFDWLLGASLTNAVIDSSGNWQVWLTLADGGHGLIVWNPAQTTQFTIPAGIQALTQHDIFGNVKAVNGSTVTIGTAPILLSSCCVAPPVVKSVTNAASFNGQVSPGSLGTVFGTGFAPAPAQAASFPLPPALGSVSVHINGVSSPLLYVESGQINFQIPFEVAPGNAVLLVQSPSGTSAEYSLSVAAAAPGIFQYNNRALATNGLGPLNTADAPASVGSVLVVYLTGIGGVTATPPDGAATPAIPLAKAELSASASIGGVSAPLKFLGLTPGFAGLAQANVQVPPLSTGDYPLVITVNGVASEPATVSVRASPP